MKYYDPTRVHGQIEKALESVKRVLDSTRNPTYAADVNHSYGDKYELAEFLTQAAVGGYQDSMGMMGTFDMSKISEWLKAGKQVSLRYQVEKNCTFIKSAKREVENATKYVTEYKNSGSSSTSTRTDKTITTITEWFWSYEVQHKLFLYPGNDPNISISLSDVSCANKIDLKTTTEDSPYPKNSISDPVDVTITWLLEHTNVAFKIDRSPTSCRTPSNNPSVALAIAFAEEISMWSNAVQTAISEVFSVQETHLSESKEVTLSDCLHKEAFIPVIPILENNSESSAEVLRITDGRSPPAMLQANDCQALLLEHKRSLDEMFSKFSSMTSGKLLINSKTLKLSNLCHHLVRLSQYFHDGIYYIEQMLMNQLVAAIGKHLYRPDFCEYMDYHNRNTFRSDTCRIEGFSYAVRKDGKTPEGVLSVVADYNNQPIQTVPRVIAHDPPMTFELNASAKVSFTGKKYIHGYVNYNFGSESETSLIMSVRARQFSCYAMLLGKIGGNDLFIPTESMIVRDKDDYRIPILLETIPTPKEFKERIESLSPEQRRFAKSYREMQLAGTLFGIVIIQIKPQLEKVLNLPPNSLTKEIQLTQHLLALFIEYQIPSDLLSYEAETDTEWVDISSDSPNQTSNKLKAVKEHVLAVKSIINDAKKEEILEAQQRRQVEAAVEELAVFEECEKKIAAPCKKKRMSLRRGKASPVSSCNTITSSNNTNNNNNNTPDSTSATNSGESPRATETTTTSEDFSINTLPSRLEARMESFDIYNSLRPTQLKVSEIWEKKHFPSLLGGEQTLVMNSEQKKVHHNQCFDLLDALTKSGAIPIEDAELHVILPSSHCFSNSLMETVYKNNINPITQVENSILILASTILDRSPSLLVNPDQLNRIKEQSPELFK